MQQKLQQTSFFVQNLEEKINKTDSKHCSLLLVS